jgi:hypothetical protein
VAISSQLQARRRQYKSKKALRAINYVRNQIAAGADPDELAACLVGADFDAVPSLEFESERLVRLAKADSLLASEPAASLASVPSSSFSSGAVLSSSSPPSIPLSVKSGISAAVSDCAAVVSLSSEPVCSTNVCGVDELKLAPVAIVDDAVSTASSPIASPSSASVLPVSPPDSPVRFYERDGPKLRTFRKSVAYVGVSDEQYAAWIRSKKKSRRASLSACYVRRQIEAGVDPDHFGVLDYSVADVNAVFDFGYELERLNRLAKCAFSDPESDTEFIDRRERCERYDSYGWYSRARV